MPAGFYPSCVCRLTIRFEEALTLTDTRNAAQLDPTLGPGAGTALAGFAATRNALTNPPGFQLGYSKGLLLPPGPPVSLGGLEMVPRSASIELPGVRQAGKFDLEIAYRDLPIDPRTVRACRVEIFLGAVQADQFARGEQLATHVAGVPTQDLLMVGTVDLWDAKHSNATSVVRLEGRDLVGILLDTKLPLQFLQQLDLSKNIVDVIHQILSGNKAVLSPTSPLTPLTGPTGLIGQGLDIVVEADLGEWGGEIPVLGRLGELTETRKGVAATSAQMTPNSQKISYWDLITRYCALLGAVPQLRTVSAAEAQSSTTFTSTGKQLSPGQIVLSVRRARNLFAQQKTPTPFAGGQPRKLRAPLVEKGQEQDLFVRRLVFGRDISEFNFQKKFHGTVVPTVRTWGVDDTKRGSEQLINGQWPPPLSQADQMKQDSEILNIPYHGIRDKKRLNELARDIYEEVGRGELGGTAQTKWLTSFGGDATDPDLLRLRPGDAVELVVDVRQLGSRAPLVNELVNDTRTPFEQAVTDLANRLNVGTSVARIIVATARGMLTQTLSTFRTATVKYGWDVKKGINVTLDYQNYVIARNETADKADSQTGQKVSTRTQKTPAAPTAPTGSAASQQPTRPSVSDQLFQQQLGSSLEGSSATAATLGTGGGVNFGTTPAVAGATGADSAAVVGNAGGEG